MNTSMIKPGLRACPDCGNTHLSTLERLLGDAHTSGVRVDDDGTVQIDHTGDTTVDWNSSTTVGVSCECGWSYDGDDWLDQLVERPGRAADAKIDYVSTCEGRTVKAVDVEIRKVVWTDGSRSYEVYRTTDDKDLAAAECFDAMPTDEQIANLLDLLDWQSTQSKPGDQFAYSLQVPAGCNEAFYLLLADDGGWSVALVGTVESAEQMAVTLGRFDSEEAAKNAAQVAEEGYRARTARVASGD